MELCINTTLWRRRPLAQALDGAATLGVQELELDATPGSTHLELSGGPAAWTALKGELGACRVAALDATHPGLPCAEEEGGMEAVEHTAAALKAARFLGASVVVVSMGSTGIDAWDQAWERAVDALRMLVKHGQRQRVRLAVELNRADVLNSLKKARRLLEEIPDTTLGIALDTGLAYAMRIDWPEALLTAGTRLYHVRLRDADRRTEDLPVGEGEVRFPAVFRQLRAHGYAGALSVTLQGPAAAGADAAVAHLRGALASGEGSR